ncbi:ArsR/SmtB family transcription factor [Poseidonibacter ostreae]|jgi:ArsR family transcriptional regulator, arsenate/arsenite/antimonite-responsive transcriptional repressor|uniref:Metalloregulator ArsR/SmtB family transcription factor n=1 Tax=Poseidonibacter ostreae TaxID=2654171 RepID=A0A6L4WT92_9BACT|nr:metalloregulator ArsR/SmtB family transcription factor [Poseidonibacter ostreae]KAB7885896.1 metalloregulator ArsR/SmtB family transcription factor [Poseidonibacter ostreae]KAB7889373.1 metalloregulator ArsR/SmtB family transcription factor [Poseidonibacter ostreae]KAB7891649.1 metalloregulator ArsR/SmtB family transcription factor [Poseidonibacter ostreae]MAC83653.1 transcriptional regulator [Arcobacter sp.]|tara:strand:+ start:5470 stop:5775 length:306 start_codon:yes stop_codon:yes gene_type:complete
MDIFLKTVSALNDETRIKLLKFIDIHGKCCVCDLENSFEMIQSRLSRHLKILKEAGFLKVEREGRWAYYSIRTPLDEFRISAIKEINTLDIDLPNLKKACN